MEIRDQGVTFADRVLRNIEFNAKADADGNLELIIGECKTRGGGHCVKERARML